MNNISFNLEKHVRALSEGIGVRLAGSAGERQAAEYLRDECLKYTQLKNLHFGENVIYYIFDCC